MIASLEEFNRTNEFGYKIHVFFWREGEKEKMEERIFLEMKENHLKRKKKIETES